MDNYTDTYCPYCICMVVGIVLVFGIVDHLLSKFNFGVMKAKHCEKRRSF
jgi:hypothetical protein